MRITFVLPPVNMSGGIRVITIYALALTKMGHRVTLVSVPEVAIPLRRKLRLFFSGMGWPRVKAHASYLDNIALKHHVLERYRPVIDSDVPDADIVIATWWETAEWVAALNVNKGVKIYFIQGYEVFDYLPVQRCVATYRLPLRKIVIAKWLADLMRREYGDEEVYLVPNSVDHRQFNAPVRGKQPVPTIGFLYHEARIKGMDVVLEVLAQLRDKCPGLKAVCFGSQPPSGRFFLDDYIEFHLDPPQDTIRDLYQRCDVWLAASRSEGFNLTAMEAMACRLPVVSTRTGWPEEAIISGRNGVLVDVDDIDGLVSGVEWVLGLDDGAWRVVSEHAYLTVANSTWQKSARLFEQAVISIHASDQGRPVVVEEGASGEFAEREN